MTEMGKGANIQDNDAVDVGVLLGLFESVVSLGDSERERYLETSNLDAPTLQQLKRMLSISDRSYTVFDSEEFNFDSFSEWHPEEWVGRKLGEFAIEALIHSNHFSAVYTAREESDISRPVVIKMLRADAPEGFKDRFKLEQNTLARLNHPSIVTIYQVGVSSGDNPFIVMEYIVGRTLLDHCDAEQLSLEARLELFIKVCDAISFAHQSGVIHRDIKPANVMVRRLDSDDIPIVIDFGLSGPAVESFESGGQTIVGTPEFMSPEQMSSNLASDARSDVYSLGMLFFTLLVGKKPLDREHFLPLDNSEKIEFLENFSDLSLISYFENMPPETKHKVAMGYDMDAQGLRRKLKPELDWIFARATNINPAERYSSVLTLAWDVRRFLQGQVVRAKTVSTSYKIKKFVLRNKLSSACLIAAIVGAISFIVNLELKNSEISRQIALKEEQRVIAEHERDLSNQTLELFERIFGMLDPIDRLETTERKLEKVLESAVREAFEDSSLDPVVRDKVVVLLASIYKGAEEFDTVIDLTNRLIIENKTQDPDMLIKATLLRAEAHQMKGKANEAKEDLSSLLTQHEPSELPIEYSIPLLKILSSAAMGLNDYKLGVESLQESVQILRLAEPTRKNQFLLAEILQIFGSHYNLGEDFAKAKPLLQESVDLYSRLLPKDHGLLLEAEMTLEAASYGNEQQAALSGMEDAFAELVSNLGSDSPRIFIERNRLIHKNMQLNKLQRARELSREQLSIANTTIDPGDFRNIYFLVDDASVSLLMNDAAAAREAILRSIAIRERHFPDDENLELVTKMALGRLELAEGNWNEAVAILSDLYSERIRIHGKQDVMTGNAGLALCRALVGHGDFYQAKSVGLDSIDSYGTLLPDNDWRILGINACAAFASYRLAPNIQTAEIASKKINEVVNNKKVPPFVSNEFQQWLAVIEQ